MEFKRGSGNYKYKVILPSGKSVSFGDKRYQHFKDQTPLKLYSHLDHLDPKRRASYRARHGAMVDKNGKRYVDKKYSAAWFSYHYLW
jgi:hypothetical protein